MTNHGGARDNAGRPHIDGTPAGEQPSDPVRMVNVRLTESMIAHLQEIADGNISEGIRKLIRRDMQ